MTDAAAGQQNELVSRAVRGDANALSSLLALHGPAVQDGLRISRQWQGMLETGDVMQVTYLEAFMQISRFRPEHSDSFLPWLRRMAENNLRDAIRGLERQKHPPPRKRLHADPAAGESSVNLYEILATSSSTPSRAMARKDICRLIDAALDRLPTDYARVVRMYDLENKDIAEVAASVNRSTGAVHMMRARAHERLGELLETASSWFASVS